MQTLPLRAAIITLLLVGAVIPAQAQRSMYADPKAANAGDLLTVVLVERTSAQRQSAWSNAANSALGGSGDVGGGTISGIFSADASFNKAAQSNNRSSQEDLLNGTVTTRVVQVDEGGNLFIEGERKLNVNGETHLLRISGIVRPIDVRSNNTILSPDIANAEIEYRRSGIHRRFFRPGMLARIGALGLLAAAVALGS
ncbi:MAG: flagellar basal body L-ring protein FlgH [Rhodothermales bacterium]